jgi:hypothetical protein
MLLCSLCIAAQRELPRTVPGREKVTYIEESCLVGNIFMGGACLNVRADLLGQGHDTVQQREPAQITWPAQTPTDIMNY